MTRRAGKRFVKQEPTGKTLEAVTQGRRECLRYRKTAMARIGERPSVVAEHHLEPARSSGLAADQRHRRAGLFALDPLTA